MPCLFRPQRQQGLRTRTPCWLRGLDALIVAFFSEKGRQFAEQDAVIAVGLSYAGAIDFPRAALAGAAGWSFLSSSAPQGMAKKRR